ncbi:MAG: head maturation protease, ClpP-related [Janthinobacterium lividum]
MRNPLMALYSANRGKGSPLAIAVNGAEATVEIYDMLVASSADVDWYGGGVAADAFARELRGLDVETIHLRINCPGGDVFAGVAMAQAIREQKATVIAHVDGYAASAASLLTVVADKAVIAPGGMVMIHKAWTIGMGNADDFTATASLLGKIDDDLAAAYTAKAGDGDWLAAMAAETWYRADEAVAAGLCDSIAESAKKMTAAMAFDLTAYAHAPAALKPADPVEPPITEAAIAEQITAIFDAHAHRLRAHALRMRANS